MRIIGATTKFPELNEARQGEAAACSPYACARPRAKPGELAFDFALPAVREALKQAGCRPSGIDLILGLGLSPDHVVDVPEHITPRVNHPLQRALGATNAYTFDLADGDWSFAVDVAAGYVTRHGYERVLLVRSEVTAGLLPDLESGFAMPDGAGVLLLCQDEGEAPPWTRYRSLEGFRPPAVRVLSRQELAASPARARLFFPFQEGLVKELNRTSRELLREELAEGGPVEHLAADSWFPGHMPAAELPREKAGKLLHPPEWLPHPGPFTLPLAAASLLSQGEVGELASLTFNPFNLCCACQRLRI